MYLSFTSSRSGLVRREVSEAEGATRVRGLLEGQVDKASTENVIERDFKIKSYFKVLSCTIKKASFFFRFS
jgi:hypothetical protein